MSGKQVRYVFEVTGGEELYRELLPDRWEKAND